MTRLEPTRSPEMMSHDRADLDRIFNDALVAHVGFVVDGSPVSMPTAAVLWGDRVVIHGSTGSRWMRTLAQGIPASLSMAAVDGVVVARSAFESSVLYRSAVLFGSFTVLDGADKSTVLRVLTERILPGRTTEVRESSVKEHAATLLLAMPVTRWAVRISDDWPDDDEADLSTDVWAGHARFEPAAVRAVPAPGLAQGIPVPPSVAAIHGIG